MFQRVYFAPRKTFMKLFTDIATKPAFAHNVKELIYDGRLFLPELGNFHSYCSAFCVRLLEEANNCGHYVRNCLFVEEANFADDMYQDSIWNSETLEAHYKMRRGHPSDFHAIVANSLVRYARLLEQQESIFTKGRDLKALSEGLNSFRNIIKISVVVDFDNSLIYDLHADDRDDQDIERHRWYSTRSYTEFGLTVPPSKWCHEPGSEDAEQPGSVDEEQPWWLDVRWDVRGVHNLIQAISTHSPRLQELRIGSMLYTAPMTIFQLPDTQIEKIASLARGLTTLSIYLYVTVDGHDSDNAKQHHCLGTLLQEAKKLHSLSLSSSDEIDFDKDDLLVLDPTNFGLYLGKQWPHLTQLTLIGACVEARDLMSIFWAHKESLRELSLRGIVFLGADGWDDFSMKTGQILKLHFVSLFQLSNEVLWAPRQTWPRGEQGYVLIVDMMQWAHPDEIEIEESFGTFTGRLKASLKTGC